MDYLVGIDLGSTSLKAVVYDTGGNAVAGGSRPTERRHPDPDHPDWTVWDPDQIWTGTAAAVREAVAALPEPRRIRGVAVSGLGMDGVPVDSGGRWLYPFISWLCPRTAPQQDWWEKTIGAPRTFSIGGNTLWRHSTALRILWMAEHEPGILARTDKWLLIEDFVNFMLCGRRCTDYSMASCTLLFDQVKRSWSAELLSLSGIDGRLLCEALPSGSVIGEVSAAASAATGLPAGTPVVLGGHDYLCGALPVGAMETGTWLDVSGTWEVVLASLPRPILTGALQGIGATVECHVARDMYSVMGSAVSAEMLEWYRREYGLEARLRADSRGCSDWDCLMEEAATAPAGSHGVMFLPHMNGAGCPGVDPQSRGGFIGLAGGTTRGDMLRSLIEGLDFQLMDIVSAMRSHLDIPVQRIVTVGGAVRNAFWMQNKADVLNARIETTQIDDASPLGAAMLAGIGVGIYRDEKDAYARVKKQSTLWEPDRRAAARYAELFPVYRELAAALRGISHSLGEIAVR
jgi:xylulokinase